MAMAGEYADLLATTAVERGLIGPREVPRLWDRHILNCAVIQERIPLNSRVADIGSGAGLPGLVLAIARPDLDVSLIEPLLRRTTWLEEVLDDIHLDRVTVIRDRADAVARSGLRFDVATARAVAPLSKLAGWALPLLRPGGRLLAVKGALAMQELSEAETNLVTMKSSGWSVVTCGAGLVSTPTTVVEIFA